MIKVRFYTDDRDVCSIMEENLTGGIEIEDWLMQRMDGISFDSMDSRVIWNSVMTAISRVMQMN